MIAKLTTLTAAAALLVGSAAIGVAQTPGKSDEQLKREQLQMQQKQGGQSGTMNRGDATNPPATTGTGASTPVPPGGATGSASGTSGTDKQPGTPSHKTQ